MFDFIVFSGGEMQSFKNMPVLVKFLSAGIGVTVIIIAVLFYLYYRNDQTQTVQSFVEKSRAICLVSESIRDEMEEKWKMGIFSSEQLKQAAAKGEMEKALAMIPVVSAWNAAMRKAQQGGYTFRVPKFEPRNPKNEPDYGSELKIEGPALEKIKQENLDEYYVIDTHSNSVRYFLPVRLSKVCLNCHGDPALAKTIWGRDDGTDPTGGAFENWKEGEIHGAFEIIQSLDPADEALRSRMLKAVFIVLAGIAVACAIFFYVSKLITRPLIKGVKFAESIADGDLKQNITVDQSDEIGLLSTSLNKMSETLRQMIGKIDNSVKTLDESSNNLDESSETLFSESRDTTELSHSVAAAAEEMSSNMNSVAAAVEETSVNINSVSAAAEEMSATITEIAKNSEKSKEITTKAVEQTNNASKKVKTLGIAAKEIGLVTNTINDISDQVNLLSLNATIEAARAGEAGKGFAVVANEIKDLAHQTANATEEISNKIENMQQSTDETINEIKEITRVISEVNEIVTSIAVAVHEQSDVTNEIAENVSQASLGVAEATENVAQSSSVAAEVARDISSVSSSATQISERSESIRKIATELNNQSNLLNEMMRQFKLS